MPMPPGSHAARDEGSACRWRPSGNTRDGREFPWGDAFEYGRASDAHHYLLVIGRKGN